MSKLLILLAFAIFELPRGFAQFGNKVTTRAVVIGISDYQDEKIPDLQYAHRDAEAFAHFLLHTYPGGVDPSDLILLTNEQASGGRVHNALNGLLEQSRARDEIIIFFSGHGDVETVSDVEEGHLLLHDTPSNNYQINSLRLEDLKSISNQLTLEIGAEVILITDACRSGHLAGEVINGAQLTAADLARQFGKETKIMSCQPDEFSMEGEQWGGGRGVFSYHLVEGLTGLADNNKDLQISLREIQRYLEDWVEEEAAPHVQSPDVIGNKNKIIATVDESNLVDLIRNKSKDVNTSSEALASIIVKGLEYNNPEVSSLVDSFYQALSSKYYLPEDAEHRPELVINSSASEFYDRILTSGIPEEQIKGITGDFVAALQDDAQQAINAYLKSDNDELLERLINMGRKYSLFPKYLEKAVNLVGPTHYLYSQLLVKQYYFESVCARISNRYSKKLPEVYEEAQKVINKALFYEDRAAYLYNEMGLLLSLLRDTTAIEMYLNATELAPQWGRAHCNLAFQYYKKKDYVKAEYWAMKAMDVDPKYNQVADILSSIYIKTGRWQEGEKLLKEYISSNGPDFWIYNKLGDLYAYKDSLDLARNYFMLSNEVIDNFYAHFSLAFYPPAGELEFQRFHLEEALQIRPYSSDAWNNLGWLYQDSYHDLEKAKESYLTAVEIRPNMLYPNLNLGKIFFFDKNYEYSKLYFRKVLEDIKPNNPVAYYFLAQIAALEDNRGKAFTYLEEAIKKGYSDMEDILNNPSFLSIKDQTRFQNLLLQIEK